MPKLTHWPYVPGRPEFAQVPFTEAAKVNPAAQTFIGHDAGRFYFQEQGNLEVVVVDVCYHLTLYGDEFSFESDRAREAFLSGWSYATYGDDPEGHRAIERDARKRESYQATKEGRNESTP